MCTGCTGGNWFSPRDQEDRSCYVLLPATHVTYLSGMGLHLAAFGKVVGFIVKNSELPHVVLDS